MVLSQSVLRPPLISLEEVHQFLVKLWSDPGGRSTIFAGAGISVPGPSHLPTARDVIEHVTKALTNHPLIENYHHELAESLQQASVKMEILFEIVQQSAGVKLAQLFKVFDGKAPNLYHHFVARLLENGSVGHLITTNFDRLIEKACAKEPVVFASDDEHKRRASSAIYKIHGTVDRPETIVAVLKQVSRGLGLSKRQLMVETLSQTCLVLGWSDDDIDLTPAFFQSPEGLLLWFSYDPDANSVIDFSFPTHDASRVHPKIERLLRERRGVLISCDPLPLLISVWQDLKERMGPLSELHSAPPPDILQVTSIWAESLTLFERLIIVSDIFRHVVHWEQSQSLLKQAERVAATAEDRFNVHYRLGLCFTNLSRWRDAFDSFDACLTDKGYKGTIEELVSKRPVEDPDLAVLYGNLATLFQQVGRVHDSLVCNEMDAALCERYFPENRSSAYANLAISRCELGDWTGAAHAAEKAAKHGIQEGDLLSVAISHQALANCAMASGEWHKVQHEIETANEIAELLSRPDFQIECLKGLAQHCYRIGEVDRSQSYVNEALQIALRHDLTDSLAELWMIAGVTLKEKASILYPLDSLPTAPELRESLEAYDRSLAFLSIRNTNQKLRSIILNNRGLLLHLMKENERAVQDLWESLSLRTNLLDDIGRATVLNNLALVIMGNDEAEEFLLEALSIYERFGHKVGRCQVMHDLAGVHMIKLKQLSRLHRVQRRREYRIARNYLEESLRLAEELRAPVKIKQAQHNLRVLESLA